MKVHAIVRPVLGLLWQAIAAAASDDGLYKFNYAHHGQDWRQAACGSRDRQSPINFDGKMMRMNSTQMKLYFSYEPVTGDVPFQNDGHALTADFAGAGYGGISYEGGWYNLFNINIHAKSEHTFDGRHTALELHLVHKRYDGPALLVVAVPIDCDGKPDIDLVPLPDYNGPTPDPFTGDDMTRSVIDFANPAFMQRKASLARGGLRGRKQPQVWYSADEKPYVAPDPSEPNSNPVLQKLVNQLPPKFMRKITIEGSEVDPIDINLLLKGGTYFEYTGSFTVPPCTEMITWFVRREPIMASDSEVRILYETIYEMTHDFGNYRSVMPLAGRPVTIREGDHSIPIQKSDLNIKGAPPSARQFGAQIWAADALKQARENARMARELGNRIGAAGQAHADQLDTSDGPGPPYNGSKLVPTFPQPPGFGEPPCTSAACNLAKMGDQIRDQINATAYKVVHESAKRIGENMHEATIEAVNDVMVSLTPPPETTPWPPPILPTRSPPIVPAEAPAAAFSVEPLPPSPAPAPMEF